jgi:hypothetical protein
MNTQAIRKWEGILSLVLTSLAYVFGHKVSFESFNSGFVVIFGWWIIALLLATGGLCSESRIGKLAGWVTFFGFFFFWLWLPRIRA